MKFQAKKEEKKKRKHAERNSNHRRVATIILEITVIAIEYIYDRFVCILAPSYLDTKSGL